jgi:hypothetical protein
LFQELVHAQRDKFLAFALQARCNCESLALARRGNTAMSIYGNDHDVTDRVKTTDDRAVNQEIDRIFLDLYPQASTATLDRAFADMARLYRGEYPGYLCCDTAYHDIQHVLDVTLAMARLIDGYESSRVRSEPLGRELFQLGVITALFHDSGYIRSTGEAERANGAEFTRIHVSRGALFLRDYLPRIGLGDQAAIAAELIHFTGYERPIASIPVPGLIYRLLGNLLGSADIIAQMSDRCYLEKCRDRLYPEFVAGGLTKKHLDDGAVEVVFSSGEDLLIKTPDFYQSASRRLQQELGGGFAYAAQHFGGQNLYMEGVQKNIRFAQSLHEESDAGMLKRIPPDTLTGSKTRH